MEKRKIFNVGIYDIDDLHSSYNCVDLECQKYRAWSCMIVKCYGYGVKPYDAISDPNRPKDGFTMCNDWKYFSKFIAWYEKQPCSSGNMIVTCQFLNSVNKIFSPDTSLLMSPSSHDILMAVNGAGRSAAQRGLNAQKKLDSLEHYLRNYEYYGGDPKILARLESLLKKLHHI